MNYKLVLLILPLLLLQSIVRGQSLSPEVISSNGDFYTNTGGSISFTIGETVVETFNGPSNILTQGFQQPFLTVTGIADTENESSIVAYPNPFKNDIFLDFNKMENGIYYITIYDAAGKLISNEKAIIGLGSSSYHISLLNIDNGIYTIRLSNEKDCNKAVRIIKQN